MLAYLQCASFPATGVPGKHSPPVWVPALNAEIPAPLLLPVSPAAVLNGQSPD